ncbi:imidazolonepropionase [Bradyrhizobium sp. CCBAU 51765]|uniref:imidazolonepropionase n=1 Tax=Bradyrhizobium sp. CCBAU 51765 TaxID=1325102 RepID=UPI001FEF5FC0|nr:imidazolonepropionase [Bradyrhizobium sp. CCBAU 51765]
MTGENGYGEVLNGAVAAQNGHIVWVGAREGLPRPLHECAAVVHDVSGAWIMPGLIEPHTHVVYGGNGRLDFRMRIKGASRDEVYSSGGGVPGTVKATRAASEEELFTTASRRIREFIANGVTTIESKSGFGLDLDNEIKQLRVSRELGRALPVTVVSTFLGAHGVGPEFKGRPDDYITFLIDEILPAAVSEGLVDAVDGFADTIGFNDTQISRLFDAARAYDLPVRLHADQYSDASAAALAARYGALTADHLEYASEPSIEAMAKAGTVGGLLPGANFFLRESRVPPVDLLRKYQIRMAFATNSNPVSSPTNSPPAIMNLACVRFRITPEEALRGFTINAAHALGMQKDRGSLEVGKVADLSIWDIEHPDDLSCLLGPTTA